MPEVENKQLIVFALDGPAEHANILNSIKRSNTSAYEIGARLRYFRERELWRQLELNPPLTDLLDYLDRGLGLAPSTAYRYMDAACFPQWCTTEHGIEKMAELRRIVALTAAEESPEEAVALRLPMGDGTTKPFAEATVQELRQARKVLKAGEGKVERKIDLEKLAAYEAARTLESKMEEASRTWLTAEQVLARRRGNEIVFDLRGVKASDGRKVLAALLATLPE